jgi:fatty acid desaturase
MTSSQQSLHHRVERAYGTGDLRMLYGMAAPFLVAVVLEIAMIAAGASWLAAPMMLIVALLTAVVLLGLRHLLADEDGSDELR